MDYIERDEKIKQLKHLIERKTVGNAEQLALKIGVSRATLFRLIGHLKIREQREIRYSKTQNHYYFEN